MTSPVRKRSIRFLLAMLLPLALFAAACSDSDSDSTESDTSGEESTDDEASGESTGETEDEVDQEEQAELEEDIAAGEEGPENVEVDEVAMSPGNNMGSPPAGDTADLNIAEIAAGTADVSILTRLVITAGLFPTVRDGGPFTVFAPTNEAFGEIPAETLEALRMDRAAQADIILGHVVPGTLTVDDLEAVSGGTLETAAGTQLTVEVDGDEISVGGALVVLPDVLASNGVVHVIDSVIT
ncbi:MAG: fasciclin domain-containing protein [Microthrixaceae bacterium]